MRTKKLIQASLLAALCCVATMLIKIPLPYGFLNAGDAVVLLCGWLLSPVYGFFAAAIGSGLADIFAGYAVYAPATFLIKGLVAYFAFVLCRVFSKKQTLVFARIESGLLAEAFMVLGYFLFESIVYGIPAASVGLGPNGVQGAAGVALGVCLAKLFEKNKIL